MLTSFMGSNENRTLKSKNPPEPSHLSHYEPEGELDRARLVEALSKLQDLLEEYAPSWYTEEHHKKAMAALHPLRRR